MIKIKKNFEFLNLEINKMSGELRNYIGYLDTCSLNRGTNLESLSYNLSQAHKRRTILHALEEKMKLKKYSTLLRNENVNLFYKNFNLFTYLQDKITDAIDKFQVKFLSFSGNFRNFH